MADFAFNCYGLTHFYLDSELAAVLAEKARLQGIIAMQVCVFMHRYE